MPPTSCADLPLTAAADGVRIAVRLTPRARADRLDGIARLADGSPVLRVSVTAPPVDSRANDALVQFLAKHLSLPRRDFTIIGGQKSRLKLVHIAGEPGVLLPRLTAALAALPQQ